MRSESVWECINTRMSGYQDIAIPNPLAKFKLGHTRILAILPVPSFAKTSKKMSGECLDGVCGSPTVSGSYLGVSSRCLGEYRCHINHKQLNRSRHIKLLPFLRVTSHCQKVLNFGVSVGCLEGV